MAKRELWVVEECLATGSEWGVVDSEGSEEQAVDKAELYDNDWPLWKHRPVRYVPQDTVNETIAAELEAQATELFVRVQAVPGTAESKGFVAAAQVLRDRAAELRKGGG